MVENRIINLDGKKWNIYSVKPGTKEIVFCPDCSRSRRNGMLHQFTDDDLTKRRAAESIIEMYQLMRRHNVYYISREGYIRPVDNSHSTH